MAHLTRFSYNKCEQMPCFQAIENMHFVANVASIPQKCLSICGISGPVSAEIQLFSAFIASKKFVDR